MNENIESQSQSNNPSSTTPSALAEVTLAWASATHSSSIETNSTLKFAPRNYPHTPDQIAKELRVDEEGNLWWRYFNGTPRKMNRPVGTIKDTGYKVTRLDKHLYRNSALVWCLYYSRWPLPGKVIDHINHNELDDRKENLREVSNAENGRNRKWLQSNNKSGVVGVSWATDRNKWYVQLKFNGKPIPGGHYESFEDAVSARRQLEIDYGVADYAIVTACTSPKSKTLDSISVFQHFNR